MGGRRVAAIGIALACIAAMPARARALDPAPADSFAAISEQIALALRAIRDTRAAAGLDDAALAPLRSCDELAAFRARCGGADLKPCLAALVDAFRLFGNAQPSDPLRQAATSRAAARIAGAAFRLAAAEDAAGRGSCDRIAPEHGLPSKVELARDGRTLIVKPLTPLRGGRKYALVASGLGSAELAAARETVVPRGGSDARATPGNAALGAAPDNAALRAAAGNAAGALSAIVLAKETYEKFAAAQLGGAAPSVDATKVAALMSRLRDQAAVMPGLGTFSSVRLTLPGKLSPEQLRTVKLYFASAHVAPPSEVVTVFRTLDARAGLRANRSRLRALPCADVHAVPADPIPPRGPHVASVLKLEVPTLDVSSDPAAGPLGTAASAAAPTLVPALLALPQSIGPDTPLVLGVNGHMGTAERLLAQHAEALTARGMAFLVVDLPEQGMRGHPGSDILDVLDPARLSRLLRQAATDALAGVRLASACGIVLPNGDRFKQRQVRYLGYSLGAMVGTMVRSIEPDLGATVLVAPGGDMVGWLMLRLAPALGSPYVTCLGGAQHGETCFGTGKCAAPGVCIVDPGFELLYQSIDAPYEQVASAADPLAFATERTGATSGAPLLILTAGKDAALHPALASALADAYGMRPVAPHRKRGPRATLVQWPALAHDLIDQPQVREQAYLFLESRGRRVPASGGDDGDSDDGWYQVFGPGPMR